MLSVSTETSTFIGNTIQFKTVIRLTQSYTSGHFIWNLFNMPKARFITFIWNDLCKILYIKTYRKDFNNIIGCRPDRVHISLAENSHEGRSISLKDPLRNGLKLSLFCDEYPLFVVCVRKMHINLGTEMIFVVVVLVFYGPSIHFRSFRAASVDLSTLFLGKPPMQFTSP